jgi:hypothetical protein
MRHCILVGIFMTLGPWISVSADEKRNVLRRTFLGDAPPEIVGDHGHWLGDQPPTTLKAFRGKIVWLQFNF